MFSKIVLVSGVLFSSSVFAAAGTGKCSSYPKLAALEWAAKLFESDIETAKLIGPSSVIIDMKAPVLQVTAKNPAGVFESYVMDWTMSYKGKNWKYTATYLYDEECHRLRDAEFKAGKGSEVKKD